jgi:hypothetical protein
MNLDLMNNKTMSADTSTAFSPTSQGKRHNSYPDPDRLRSVTFGHDPDLNLLRGRIRLHIIRILCYQIDDTKSYVQMFYSLWPLVEIICL